MTPQDHSTSCRRFPPDLLILSGLPIVVAAMFSTWLLSLRGNDWILAYAGSLLISLVGTVLIFRAKLPLYRKGLYFTIGATMLPDRSRQLYRRGLVLSIIGISLSAVLIGLSLFW